MRGRFVSVLCLGVTALLPLPAFADIKAFNAAVSAGDYKAASVEAASTWPQLDKSRDDIGIIASEFGYAAFRSGDFAVAKTYAEFTIGSPQAANDASLLANATLLRDLSGHRLVATANTRAALSAALVKRSALPGFDNISYFAADGLIAQDISDKNWKAVAESAELAASMATSGGAYYAAPKRRFQHYANLGRYMNDKAPAVLDDTKALLEAIVADIDAAPIDDAAKVFVPVYWEVYSLQFAMERDIASRTHQPISKVAVMPPLRSERFGRLVSKSDGCRRQLTKFDVPPISEKLASLESVITFKLDIDNSGRVVNADIKGAVPDAALATRVLKWARSMRFEAGAPWDPSRCKLETTGHVVQLNFAEER